MECAYKFSRFEKKTPSYSHPEPSIPPPHAGVPIPQPAPKPKVETNFFELNLNCLKIIPQLSTGDPFICTSCGAILNFSSTIASSDSSKLWSCEFCNTQNTISIDQEEFPRTAEQNYLLESPADSANAQSENISSLEATSVIFCVDTSGSMCLKKQIPDDITINLPNASLGKPAKISRLQCMQAAVDSQLVSLREKYPNKRVGLVSFSNIVQIIGDGIASESIPKAVSEDFSSLMDFSQNQKGRFLNSSISQTFDLLRTKVMSLSAKGGTALGPALLFSIILASEGGPGSKVVICTDGLANVGIGDLSAENAQDEFYREAGSIAKELGVSVSVISIEGQDCRLEALNYVCSETEGEIVKVAPENLVTQFTQIMAQEIVATQVEIQVFLPKFVQFYNEKPKFLYNDNSSLKKLVGNATDTTSFTFQYMLKTDENLARLGISKDDIKRNFIQATFRFKGPDGKRYLKVLTQVHDVVFGGEFDEKEANESVLLRAGRRQAVKLIEEGKHEEAQLEANKWRNLVFEEKNARREEFLHDMDMIESNLNEHLVSKAVKPCSMADEFTVMNHVMKKKRC